MGTTFPSFSFVKSYTRRLVDWASKRIPLGQVLQTPSLIANELVQVYGKGWLFWCLSFYNFFAFSTSCTQGDPFFLAVSHLLAGALPTLPCLSPLPLQVIKLCLERDAVRLHGVPPIPVHLVIWLDGTSSGIRSLTCVKFRVLDPSCALLPNHVSKVYCWMEGFFSESHMPLEIREMIVDHLNECWRHDWARESWPLFFDKLVIVADHKQMCCICGVQGGSTSQRCSLCTAPASLFVVDPFAGAQRTMTSTAIAAERCAAEVLLSPNDGVAIRRRFDNVGGIPLLHHAPCIVSDDKVIFMPPPLHCTRNILEGCLDFILGVVGSPHGAPHTLGVTRTIIFRRMDGLPSLHSAYARWSTSQYRRCFAHWETIFDGLLAPQHTCIPFMASIISFILYSSQALLSGTACGPRFKITAIVFANLWMRFL